MESFSGGIGSVRRMNVRLIKRDRPDGTRPAATETVADVSMDSCIAVYLKRIGVRVADLTP